MLTSIFLFNNEFIEIIVFGIFNYTYKDHIFKLSKVSVLLNENLLKIQTYFFQIKTPFYFKLFNL